MALDEKSVIIIGAGIVGISSAIYLLIVPTQDPIFLTTIGNSLGPITNIAMITITSNSNQPICGI